ncbi:hypothetical protein ACVXZ0_04330 [Staphylococcus aureus]
MLKVKTSLDAVSESFRVLMKELQSLGLDVKVMDEQDNEIDDIR